MSLVLFLVEDSELASLISLVWFLAEMVVVLINLVWFLEEIVVGLMNLVWLLEGLFLIG